MPKSGLAGRLAMARAVEDGLSLEGGRGCVQRGGMATPADHFNGTRGSRRPSEEPSSWRFRTARRWRRIRRRAPLGSCRLPRALGPDGPLQHAAKRLRPSFQRKGASADANRGNADVISDCRTALRDAGELTEPLPTRRSGTVAIPLHPRLPSDREFDGTLG
jgi:hypothetical protein